MGNTAGDASMLEAVHSGDVIAKSCEVTVIPNWMDSHSACTYSDDERLFGVIVKAVSEWIAFDAIHPNEDETGLRLLGVFRSAWFAKRAVEREIRASLPQGRADSNMAGYSGVRR